MAWGTLPRDGAQEDAWRGKREVPGAPQREQRQHSPSPRETEALRTGEGKRESALLTWQMDFRVEKSPAHSMSTCTEQLLPFPSPCKFIELVLNEAHILSWRWKGSSRGALRISRKSGKEAVAELQSSALSVSTTLRCGVSFKHLSFHPCFRLLPMPNKPSPVSQTFPNSSYSLYRFYNNRRTISQRKMVNPSNTCHSLVLSNRSPTCLPFHKPSHPVTFCLSLTLLSIHLFLHPTTSLSSCPIRPLTLPSICLYTHLFTHLSILPSINRPTHSISLPNILSTICPAIFPSTHPSSHLPAIHPLALSLIYSSSSLLIYSSILMLSIF